jgi:hypothetical protein
VIEVVTLLEGISPEAADKLRSLAGAAEDVDWPVPLAKRHGWLVANRAYHATQRALGRQEMAGLLDALGLLPPFSQDTQREALLAAANVYLSTGQTAAKLDARSDHLLIDISRCPIYARFMHPSGGGLTACGCFARLSGWHDALGIAPNLEMVTNMKWDDPACETRLYWPSEVSSE